MFHKATLLLLLAVLAPLAGLARANDPPVPATSLIPDNAILVIRVAEPKALIARAFDQRMVQFVQSLPPYKEAMARPEVQQGLTMVDFFRTKNQADLPTLLGKLIGGGITLALGPNDAALLIVDADIVLHETNKPIELELL